MGARLWILLAAVLFSTGGAAIKGVDLAPLQVAGMRSLLATLFLLAVAPGARRPPRSWVEAGVALAFAVTMLLFVLANRATTAANAVFLQASAPLYVLLLGPWLLCEPLRRRDVVTLAGVGAGLLLLCLDTGVPQASAPDPGLGNALAACTGVTWALAVLGLRALGRSGGAVLSVVATGNLLTAVMAFALLGVPQVPTLGESLVLVWLGAFQIGLAYVCVTRGIGSVPAFEASVLFLVEPVLGPVWAWMVHGEVPGMRALLGGALILLSALNASRRSAVPRPAHSR